MFSFLLDYTWEELLGLMETIFSNLRNYQTISQSSCTIIYSHINKGSDFFLSSLILFIVHIFIIITLASVKQYLMGFDLHFSNNKWYWASFCVLICHLQVFLDKCLFKCVALKRKKMVFIFSSWHTAIKALAITPVQSVFCVLIRWLVIESP